ncbi:GNAT family N-acetyltransferase [Pseudoruegeria sp. SK021]|uniref:GNAT family N-acetyltransferase n=1 Tax=Pseudoruegeria sp. SK021 TaxID=1933035 RepID=UPI000A24FC93|nr:GNAT family N-acyltransferase [Pseudoruegeria sp. SK021]OSP56366.1 ornithine-acyl-ACP acyltransferase [Pseudoruegeria sp. SK021]
MSSASPQYDARLATHEQDFIAAQRLRYQVFVEELGGDGPLVDHDNRLERDRFDPFCEQMILVDLSKDPANLDHVVGVYRLLRGSEAAKAGGFYSAGEFDLSVLERSGRSLLELGRSCLHPDHRGGPAMYHLWTALAAFTLEHKIEILFGTASFHGTNLAALAAPLSLLYHRHLAPEDLRVRALPEHYKSLNLRRATDLDRAAAILQVPALIKAYLRLGGFIGDGAYVDRAFNTIDVCLVLDTARMNPRQRAIYTRGIDL